jgi:hypothetical protein
MIGADGRLIAAGINLNPSAKPEYGPRPSRVAKKIHESDGTRRTDAELPTSTPRRFPSGRS